MKDLLDDTATHKQTFVVNTPPVIASTPVLSVEQGTAYLYTLLATDTDIPQGDSLTFTLLNGPSWLTLVDGMNGTGMLTGFPTLADTGSYTITVKVEDVHNGFNGTACGEYLQTFTLEVLNSSTPCAMQLVTFEQDVTCFGFCDGLVTVLSLIHI